MKQYDYIFVGAGVAGLATAIEIARREDTVSIAMIDPRLDEEDHQAFGYWHSGESLLPDGIGRSWNRWFIEAPFASVEVELGDWRYDTFDIHAWRRSIRDELENRATVDWHTASVIDYESDNGTVTAVTDRGDRLTGTWAFDSRPPDVPDGAQPLLYQSFRGWRVRTEDPTFDPDDLVLMDFRERDDVVQFAYVVPHDAHQAFVESVIVAPQPTEEEAEFALEGLLKDWTFGGWEVLEQERGCTALTTARFPHRDGARIANIGLRGGAARPSTGYAFSRIHREATEIADALMRTDEPWGRTPPRRRDQFLDSVLLTLLAEFPEEAPRVFVALFAHARTDRVLRLLDGRATWRDILAIVWILPWLVFLRASWIRWRG